MCFVCSCIYEENPSRSIKNIRKSGKNPLKIHFKILEKSKKISPRSGCYPSSMLRSLGGWSVGLAASPGHFCHQSCGGLGREMADVFWCSKIPTWPMSFDISTIYINAYINLYQFIMKYGDVRSTVCLWFMLVYIYSLSLYVTPSNDHLQIWKCHKKKNRVPQNHPFLGGLSINNHPAMGDVP